MAAAGLWKERLMEHKIVLENGAAYIDGKQFPLKTHELVEVAGKGANGVVFKAKHRFLDRVEAVKLWLPRPDDRRDKIKQGIYETQNHAATVHPQVIKILHADIIDGIYCATMDYFNGGSLRNWIKDADSTFKWTAAYAYLELIEQTSSPSLYHGDPHAGNVLIDDFNHLVLCDYGTSYYSSTEDSWDRHWKIVDEVMRQLLSHFATFELARAEHPAVFPKNSYQEMLKDYRFVFGVLGAEVYMFHDGIDRLHEDQKKVLRPLVEAGKNADGTGAYEISNHVKRIIARRRAET
jgi:serine/threonine protein kinase